MYEEESKNFDNIINDKLKNLSIDSSPSDWIMMERMLEWNGLTQDGEVTDETRFDEIAHDKLNNVQVDALTPDWSRMSLLIDKMNEEPSIEHSEFDQAIDNKIKETTADIDMAVWNRMAPVLAADREALVADLDAVAKDKLTQISEVQPAWNSMDAKINRELFLPESIVKYKVLEIALILLFAFSVSQFPLDKVTEHISEIGQVAPTEKVIAPTIIEESNVASTSQETSTAEKLIVPSEVVASTIEETVTQTTAITEPTVAETSDAIAVQSVSDLSNFALQFPPTIIELLEELKAKPRFSISEFVFNQVLDPINLPRYSAMSALFELSDITQDPANRAIDFDDFEAGSEAMAVANIDAPGFETISHPKARPSVADENLVLKQRQTKLILGVFTGSDYNEIITPPDLKNKIEGSTQWNVGYGGGVSLGMRFKNWELETGAVYSSNQYATNLFDLHSGFITSGYTAFIIRDIELDIVKVPLNFRFNVNLWDKWKVYALSGATMNMVVQSEFKTDNVVLGPQSFNAAPSAPSSNSKLAQRDFREGIFEGGNFKDNSFLTANLGFGVERSVGANWSLFAQPTYQRQIFSNGIGPNQDRYNSVSLLLGTRVALSSEARLKD